MVLTASDLRLGQPVQVAGQRVFSPASRRVPKPGEWREEIAGLTPEFVCDWRLEDATRRHPGSRGFLRRVATVLTVQGEAGVGKTRCTYEALLVEAAHHALVVYTSDEKAALELGADSRNATAAQAILVADECSLETRDRLRGNCCPGARTGFRVIAIDNSLQRAGADEVRSDAHQHQRSGNDPASEFPGASA